MTRIRLLGSLFMIVAITFFVGALFRSEGRAVYVALGVVFLLLAVKAKRKRETGP
jgi:hypothetical protein